MIVGISGKAGSGKDTVADYVCETLGFRKTSFARRLKEACSEFFNIDLYDTYNNKEKETGIVVTPEIVKMIPKLESQLGKKLVIRQVLQYFGTDLARTFCNNIWINAMFNNIDPDENAIISDVRFVNEADEIKKRGGILIRLTRNVSDMNHISETALDDYEGFDLVYDNSNEPPETTCEEIVAFIQVNMVVDRMFEMEIETLRSTIK